MTKPSASPKLLLASCFLAVGCADQPEDPVAEAESLLIAIEAADFNDADEVRFVVEALDDAAQDMQANAELAAAPDAQAGTTNCDAADGMLGITETAASIVETLALANVQSTGEAVHYQAYIDAFEGRFAAGLAADEFVSGPFPPALFADAVYANDLMDATIGHMQDVRDGLAPRSAYTPQTPNIRSAANAAMGFAAATQTWLQACVGTPL